MKVFLHPLWNFFNKCSFSFSFSFGRAGVPSWTTQFSYWFSVRDPRKWTIAGGALYQRRLLDFGTFSSADFEANRVSFLIKWPPGVARGLYNVFSTIFGLYFTIFLLFFTFSISRRIFMSDFVYFELNMVSDVLDSYIKIIFGVTLPQLTRLKRL